MRYETGADLWNRVPVKVEQRERSGARNTGGGESLERGQGLVCTERRKQRE